MSNGDALKRELGLLEVTLSGVGSILGAGIYVLIGKAAGLAGNSVWMSFLLAAVAAALTAASYMELSSMYPRSAAEYVYVEKAYGQRSAFLVGWLVIVGLVIASSTVALGFGGYFYALFGVPVIPGAIALILGFGLILLLGIKRSAQVAILMTLVEIVGLLVVIYIGVPHLGSVDYLDPPNISGVFGAATLIFFAYLGFEDIVKLSQETKEAEKTIPKALVLAILISSVLYVLVSLSVVSVLNYQALAASPAPLADVASVVLGEDASMGLSMIALFSTANTVLLMLLGGSRMIYGMADTGALPGVFASVHSQRRTPHIAILAITISAMGFTFIGNIETVANMANFTVFIIFFMVNLSLIRLRYTEPHTARPFRSPLNIGNIPVLALLGAMVTLFLFIQLDLEVVLYGSILLVAGLVLFHNIRGYGEGKGN
ncbi:MAG: APC family permease [Euryarchaeota archaeon]|nr:APC family permease [Euryarchaeota archaeon]